MTTIHAQVDADYSQFYLTLGPDGVVSDDSCTGLAELADDDLLMLTAARKCGVVPVEVQVLSEPPELDRSWDAVVEVAVRAGERAHVRGWDPGDECVDIPLTPGRDYRVRYVVVDGQAGADQFRSSTDDDEPPAERYLLQVWPADPQPGSIVVAAVPWAQYWAFGPAAERLVRDLADVPDPERLTVLVDRALDEHPDVVARLQQGDERFTLGVLRYLQELFRVTYFTPTYETQRDDHVRLNRLILERAAAR